MLTSICRYEDVYVVVVAFSFRFKLQLRSDGYLPPRFGTPQPKSSPISFSALFAFPKAFLLGYIMSTQLLLIVTTSICLSGTVYTHPGFVTRGSLCERTREFQWVGENNELPQVLAMAVILEVGILV